MHIKCIRPVKDPGRRQWLRDSQAHHERTGCAQGLIDEGRGKDGSVGDKKLKESRNGVREPVLEKVRFWENKLVSGPALGGKGKDGIQAKSRPESDQRS